MIPKIAVAQFLEVVAQLVAAMPNPPTRYDVYDGMDKANIPFIDGHLAYSFAQIGWGRLYIGEIGITFSPYYWYLNKDGNVIEEGLVADNPYFIAALELAPQYQGSNTFKLMAYTSSIVSSISQGLKAGSKPEDLELAPEIIFLEDATEEGYEKMQQLTSDYFATHFKK